MSTFELVSTIVAITALAINFALFLTVILQLRALRQQIKSADSATKADHARRKKQATIEFYAATLEKRSALRSTLPSDRDGEAIAQFLIDAAESKRRARDISEYLGLFELLASGVNTGVFDRKVIARMAGGRIRAMVENYRPWIERQRTLLDAPLLYVELEALAEFLTRRVERRRERAMAAHLSPGASDR
jgi:hypothetical protein